MAGLFPQMYAEARQAEEWYARIPEAIESCNGWLIETTTALILPGNVSPEQQDYLISTVRMAVHANALLASGFGPYAAQGFRTLLERAAIIAASSIQSPEDWLKDVELLTHNDVKERKRATQGFVEKAAQLYGFQELYDILSQRFTHVTAADSVPNVDPSMLEPGLDYRDEDGGINRGYWVYALTLADVLLMTVEAVSTLSPGSGQPVLKGNAVDTPTASYVQAAKAWICEQLTPNSPGDLRVLLRSSRDVPGEVSLFDMHRRSMTVHHLYDDPETVYADVKQAIFELAAPFALGNKWREKGARIHEREPYETGRAYEIKWPSGTEISWVAMSLLASHYKLSKPVDYVGEMQRRARALALSSTSQGFARSLETTNHTAHRSLRIQRF